ncbi:MAG TPA: hypothetical protein VMW66_03005 [Elusimicrobiales bacterium]|nr:hypothetical protein [Elusimicrobiales bacterium]
MPAMTSVISNLETILDRIQSSASRSNRDSKDIELIAVTKYANPKDIVALLQKDKLTHIGETKVQDASEKWNSSQFLPYKNKVKKHLIGHLQSNKAGRAVDFFDYIDSVDSLKLADILNRKAGEISKKMPVLV